MIALTKLLKDFSTIKKITINVQIRICFRTFYFHKVSMRNEIIIRFSVSIESVWGVERGWWLKWFQWLMSSRMWIWCIHRHWRVDWQAWTSLGFSDTFFHVELFSLDLLPIASKTILYYLLSIFYVSILVLGAGTT